MSQTIKLKRSSVVGKVPTTGNLDLGEIALNTNDGKVFFKKNDGTESVQTIVTTDSLTTGSIIVSGSTEVTGSSNITGSFSLNNYSLPETDGEDGQVIMTDGAGGLVFNDVVKYVTVKNIETVTLQKGTPVHATSSVGNTVEVVAASASLARTMPATFVLNETLDPDEEGRAILTGFINGVNTSGFNEGDVVYVGESSGYTNVKPTGTNLIQNLGIVSKIHPSNGSGYIYGSGRSNDVPNLLNGEVFFGEGNVSIQKPIGDILSGSSYVYSGSFSGSFEGDGSGLTGITADGTVSQSGQVDHDQTLNFVSDEHIDHSTVDITAGSGLTGGGNITTSRTLNVGAGDGITVNADDIQVDGTVLRTTGDSVVSSSTQIDHDQTTNYSSDEHFTQANITTVGTVTSGDITGILPSGTVSGSAQLTNTFLEITGDSVVSSSAQIDHDSTTNYSADEHFTQANITTLGTVTVGNVDAILPSGTFSGSITAELPSGVISSSAEGDGQGQIKLNGVNVNTNGLGTDDSPQFTNLTLSGDLTVNGTTTTVNSTEVEIGDRIIVLNGQNAAGDSGINVYDTATNQTGSLLWDTTSDYWKGGLLGSEARFLTVDDEGSGNGLDADTLDTYHATDFIRKGEDVNTTLGNSTDNRATVLTLNHSSTDIFGIDSDIGDAERNLTIQNPNSANTNGMYTALHMQVLGTSARVMGDIKFVRDSGTRGKWYFTSKDTSAVFHDAFSISTEGVEVSGSSSDILTLRGIPQTGAGGIKIEDPTAPTYGAHFSYLDGATEVSIGGVTAGTRNDVIRIDRDTTQTVKIDDTGVGIGTASPDDKLHVAGNIFIEDSSPEITLETGATHYNWQLAAQENKDAAFEISVGSQDADASNDTFSPLMIVSASGAVGIGTTSPSSLLHVKTTNDNTGTGVTVGVGLDNGSATTPNAIDLQNVGGTTSDAVAANFKVGGTDRAKIIGGRYSNGGLLKIQVGNTSNVLTDRVIVDSDSVEIKTAEITLDQNSAATDTIINNTNAASDLVLKTSGGRVRIDDDLEVTSSVFVDFGGGGSSDYFEIKTNQLFAGTTFNLAGTTTSENVFNFTRDDTVLVTISGSGQLSVGQLPQDGYMLAVNGKSFLNGDVNINSGQLLIGGNTLGFQSNSDVDTGTEVVATISSTSFDGAFFDVIIKNGTNLRASQVMAVHDGTSVEFSETSTNDLGDTTDVTLSVDLSGGNIRLLATTLSDNWSVSAYVRGM